jgi:hypothetical protein
LVLLLLACVLTAGLSVQMRYVAVGELAERREFLSRLETKLRADAGHLNLAAPPTAFLDAPTQSMASAKLQAYVAQLADLQHAGLMSSGAEATKREDAPDEIRLQATLDMDMKALRALLFQLESGTPYIFIDTLTVEPANATVNRVVENPLLQATMRLRAFWRRGTP